MREIPFIHQLPSNPMLKSISIVIQTCSSYSFIAGIQTVSWYAVNLSSHMRSPRGRPGQGLWVYSIWIPFNTGIWYFFLSHFGYKVSCFSWILDIQFIDMNQMFTLRSKRLFSQGSVYNFEVFWYLMGKKSGILVSHYLPA